MTYLEVLQRILKGCDAVYVKPEEKRNKKKRNTLILMDHPTVPGFVAFEKDA
jgi:hypothetical protein